MRTALVVLVCALLLLAACGQKAATVKDTGVQATASADGTTASAEVTEADVTALTTNIDSAGSQSVDTTGLDSVDSDLGVIDSLDI
jgi:uncharacterized lipoprotein YajG